MSRRQTDRPEIAIIFMIIAVAMLVAMSVFIKLIGPEYSAFQLVFLRNLVATFVLVPLVMKDGVLAGLRTRKPGLHLIRSGAGVAGVCCFFYAVQRLSIAEVTVISQAVPLFVTALAVLFLGEKVGLRRWSAVATGFFGVVLAIGPVGQLNVTALIAVAGTGLWAIALLSVRRLGATDSPAIITFYYMVLGIIVLGFVQPWVWLTPSGEMWLFIIAAGILSVLAQLLMAQALKIGEASLVMPFNYTAIVWGIAVDLAIWSVYPPFWTIVGAAVITGTGLYIFRREAAANRIIP